MKAQLVKQTTPALVIVLASLAAFLAVLWRGCDIAAETVLARSDAAGTATSSLDDEWGRAR